MFLINLNQLLTFFLCPIHLSAAIVINKYRWLLLTGLLALLDIKKKNLSLQNKIKKKYFLIHKSGHLHIVLINHDVQVAYQVKHLCGAPLRVLLRHIRKQRSVDCLLAEMQKFSFRTRGYRFNLSIV